VVLNSARRCLCDASALRRSGVPTLMPEQRVRFRRAGMKGGSRCIELAWTSAGNGDQHIQWDAASS